MQELFNNKRGAVALISVMIVTTVLLLTGLTVINYSIDSAKIGYSNNNGEIASMYANTCIEEVMYRLKGTPTYTTAGVTLTLTNGSCTFVVSNSSPTTMKIVTATGVYSDSKYIESKKVDTTTTPHTLTN